MLRIVRPLRLSSRWPSSSTLITTRLNSGLPAQTRPNFEKSKKAQQAQQVNLRSKLNSESSGREFRRLWALAKQEKWSLAVGMGFLVVSSSIGLSVPAAIGKMLDAVNAGENALILGLEPNVFLGCMGGLLCVGAAATYGRITLLRSIGERVVAKLRARTFKRIVEQDAEFFDTNRTGDLISRLGTDANVVARAVTGNIADGLRAVLTASMGVGAMAFISVKLTMLITVCLPPVLVGTYLYGRRVREISRDFQTELGALTRVGEERLNNVRTAQLFGGEQEEIRIYNKRIRSVYGVAMREARATGRYIAAMQITGNSVVLGLLAVGANMVSSGALTFGELSSFILYTGFAGTAISGLGNFYSELMKGAGAAARLFEIEDRKPLVPTFKGDVLRNPGGAIVFHNVAFSYPTRPAVPIFTDLNAVIRPNTHVCVVGPSGGGKSTVLALLMRLYDPTSGDITIGGQRLTEVSPWALRKNIGVVSQEPVLYNGTIEENIRYGKLSASREEVLAAARMANCTFLADFPLGIDTPVGPRGTQLSGGQKQRIAIARALISKPAILVLDEATSALDSESEQLVNAALQELIARSSTTISIAHRQSTIARADEVIVLGGDGKAVEYGPYKDLLADEQSALSRLLQASNTP